MRIRFLLSGIVSTDRHSHAQNDHVSVRVTTRYKHHTIAWNPQCNCEQQANSWHTCSISDFTCFCATLPQQLWAILSNNHAHWWPAGQHL